MNRSRVIETYDFTQIDLLLDPDTPEAAGAGQKIRRKWMPERREELRKELERAEGFARARPHPRLEAHRAASAHPARTKASTKDKYVPPGLDHGTHVAGILASNWKTGPTGQEC